MASMQFDRWFNRGTNLLTLWGLLPAAAVGVLTGYLASGVHWITQWGPFGWFAAGLLGFVVMSAGMALSARAKLWRLEAKARSRITSESSPFDPMARVYENKRLFLRDLAPPGRRHVAAKRFIGCEIIGPGTAVLGINSDVAKPISSFVDCRTFDVDCIEVDPKRSSHLAVTFVDCTFENCEFYHMTLLFLVRDNDTLNWITPDFNQPMLENLFSGEDDPETI